MNAAPEVAVTLSPELLARLRDEAAALDLPLEYLVAALIVDTMEGTCETVEPTLARVA
jgi:hypothetical protein